MTKTSHTLILIMAALLLTHCAAAFPVTVTDCYGNNITIREQPQRIVSLIPSNTEILFAVGAGDTVVGVTSVDNYPPEVENITKIGGYANIDIESILDLEPDVVLAYTANGNDVLDALKRLGLTVITLDSTDMASILDNIELVGTVTGHEEEASALTTNMTAVVEDISSKTASIPENERPGVLFLVSFDPMYVAGKDSFPDSFIRLAGGRNIIKAEKWPQIALEEVVDQNPQIIICSGMGTYGNTIMQQVMNNSIIAGTDAMMNQQVYVMSDSNLIERPGPRVVQGLEEIYGYISLEQTPAEAPASANTAPGFTSWITVFMAVAAVITHKGHKKT
ncbi:ABC transporter substrate-binding protein [Methanomethylovorans sp.]|uniref:ABC transporter substrate-binding protein n=1 Tax=Methanomethylovorans sp. TaxID=2758717 RepID=UPI00345E395E